MKPGRRIWADNAVWAGGPDAGVATKIPMSAGNLSDGRYRSIRPAPQTDNYEQWVTSSRLDAAASMRVMNVIDQPVTQAGWPGAWVGGPCDGIYDVSTGRHSVLSRAIADEEWTSAGSRNWAVAAVPGITLTTPRLATDYLTLRGVVDGTPLGAGTNAWASVAGGAWAAWVLSPLGQWLDIDYGGAGANARWVIGGLLAAGATPTVLISTGPAAAFFAPAGPPVWAGAPAVNVIAHSHHAAGDLYPDDPGNHVWLAMTSAEASVSVHATAGVWTAPAGHLLPAAPLDVACSKLSGEWICVCADGTLGRSYDGVVWVNDITSVVLPGAGAYAPRIATDGYGHWMIAMISAAGFLYLWASPDDGTTWPRVYPEFWLPGGYADHALWYGDGQFVIVSQDGVSAGSVHTSLRITD